MSENDAQPGGPPEGSPGGDIPGEIPSEPSSSAKGEPTIKDKNNVEIVNIIKSELKDVYFCKNEENDKKLVEQTGQDLQKIYYLDYSKTQVHPNIKREIIQSWHRALRVKIDDKLKKCPYKGHCEQQTAGKRYNGGEVKEKKTDDAGGNTETTDNGDSGQTSPPNGANGPAMPTPPPPPASSNQYIINFAKSKPKMFIEELATKSILNSYTASAVYNLHYQLIKKVNCNYAIIERPLFDSKLTEQFQSIYELFDGYLTTLSNKTESTPVFNIKPEPKSMFGGNDGEDGKGDEDGEDGKGDEDGKDGKGGKDGEDGEPPADKTNGATTDAKNTTNNDANTKNTLQVSQNKGDENEDTGKLSPTLYDLGTIRNSVSKNMTKMITAKLKTIKTEITTKFTDTFYQANLDCFQFYGDEIMNEHLSSEFNATLKYLCEKIDEESAKLIFQSYVSRNKDELNLFFKDLFDNKIDNVNFYLFDLSKVNSFIFDNPDIIPTDFNINEPEDEEDDGTTANADAEAAAAKTDENAPTNAPANTSTDAPANTQTDAPANTKANSPANTQTDAAAKPETTAAKPETTAADAEETDAAENTDDKADAAENTDDKADAAENTDDKADAAEKTPADAAEKTQSDAEKPDAAVKTDDKEDAANAKSTLENDANSDSNDIKECKPDSKSDELLQIMKTENVHSYFSLITPSVITPVFDFLKDTFNEATSRIEKCEPNSEIPFLCKLFALYSNKSIQFMDILKDKFENNKDKILDYVERYVFTKHKYTKTLLTDLIKHTFDVKQLLKNDIKKETITDLTEYFSKLVDLKLNGTILTDSDIPKFINNFATGTSLFQIINGLLNHQTEYIKNKYKEALKSMFP